MILLVGSTVCLTAKPETPRSEKGFSFFVATAKHGQNPRKRLANLANVPIATPLSLPLAAAIVLAHRTFQTPATWFRGNPETVTKQR